MHSGRKARMGSLPVRGPKRQGRIAAVPTDLARRDGIARHAGPARQDGIVRRDGLAKHARLTRHAGLARHAGIVRPACLARQTNLARRDGLARQARLIYPSVFLGLQSREFTTVNLHDTLPLRCVLLPHDNFTDDTSANAIRSSARNAAHTRPLQRRQRHNHRSTACGRRAPAPFIDGNDTTVVRRRAKRRAYPPSPALWRES